MPDSIISSQLFFAYKEELTQDMKFHLEHERICKFLLSPAGDIAFRQQIQDSLESHVRNSLKRRGRFSPSFDYMVNFFAAGFISTISLWLEKKGRTPEQTAEFLLDMMLRLERD